jgi:aryl-alcohol dehydrogenase-like predicted oxidoreductase
MKYRKMGTSDIEVSVIGQGTWALGNDFFGDVDVDLGIKAIHKSIELGVNLIDTAPGYGLNYESEYAVGKAIKGIRDKVVLSTKFGIHRIFGDYVKCLSPTVVTKELENSLTRLGTDYIDIYMIHWPDANNGIDGALELLAKFKKEGKIRAAAVSNFTVDQIKVAEEKAGIVCVQPPCNLFNRVSFENGVIPYANEKNIGIMTYGSLGGGILTGTLQKPIVNGGKEQRSGFYDFFTEPKWTKCNKVLDVLRGIAKARGVSVAEVSINWVLAQKGVTCALMGSTTPEMSIENAKAADWELSADELASIEKNYVEIMG